MKKISKVTYIQEYGNYLSFIQECRGKHYREELVLHKHHIVPSFTDEAQKYANMQVLLSVEDHIEAHYRLSKCFEEGSYEQIGNLRAVKILSKKSVKYREDLLRIYESQKGENNPAKLPENRKKISIGVQKWYSENDNFKKGKTYEEIYGDKAKEEKVKRQANNRTKESYVIGGRKASEKLKGRVTHNAQPTYFRGVEYRSLAEAAKQTGVSEYKIEQELTGIIKTVYAYPVTVTGIEYASINKACKATGMTPYKLKKQIENEKST